MKKVISLILCLMLVLSLATTAFAANITFTNGADGATYSAFKLLNATDGGNGKFAYTLNDKYTAILQSVTGKTTQADILAYISAADPNTFAENVYNAILTYNKTATEDQKIIPDKTTSNDVIVGAEQGYYLIAETELGTWPEPNNATDTYSLIMLDTLGKENIEVKTKESVPTVHKKVQEINDSVADDTGWGDSADYDIGDTIQYKIVGTVSNKYESYKNYYYSFIDTMDPGLTLNTKEGEDGEVVPDVTVFIGETDVTQWFEISKTENNGFTVTADLKKVDAADNGVTILGNTEIVVTYSAILNENAKIGEEGNKNTVILKYQNNPYWQGEGENDTPDEPGVTPPDVNVVFTFEAIVDKVDNSGNALEGAGFTLYKFNTLANTWLKIGNEITGVTTFNFKGLDVGEYKLVETTVPAGYNKANDIEFHIEAIYNTEEDPDKLIGLQVKNSAHQIISTVIAETEIENVATDAQFDVVIKNGTVTTRVVNNAGQELPETGGMGTTLIYVIGGMMVLAAVVLLVTKKRMASAE